MPPTLVVGEDEHFTGLKPETIAQVFEERAFNTDHRRRNGVGSHEEGGHRKRGLGEVQVPADHSKNVFILSKNPSPSASMDMPLSFANSVSSSFWRAVSFVGI